MTCWSMNSSSDQPSTVSPDAFEADAVAPRDAVPPLSAARPPPRPLARLRPLVDAEDVDGDEDRQQRGPGDPAAEDVDRVVRAEVEACADRADEHDRDNVGAVALPNVVRKSGDAEGGQPVEDGGAQRMPAGKSAMSSRPTPFTLKIALTRVGRLIASADVKYFSAHSIGKQSVPRARRRARSRRPRERRGARARRRPAPRTSRCRAR